MANQRSPRRSWQPSLYVRPLFPLSRNQAREYFLAPACSCPPISWMPDNAVLPAQALSYRRPHSVKNPGGAVWDVNSHAWKVDPGKFVIRTGDSAENTPVNQEITLK